MARLKGSRKKNISTTPKSIRENFNFSESPFKWSFEKCLWAHNGWQACNSPQFFVEHIISKLQNLEKMNWQEILNAAGGKSEGRGNNNHFINGDKLPSDEKNIFIKLGYMRKYEKVFSLRLSGTERLIGVVDLNVFKILWFDANHRFF